MKSISTGFGLAILGGCIFGAAVVASPQLGRDAFAQGTGGERRIVVSNLMSANNVVLAYRIWSDNAIDVRVIGSPVWENVECRSYAPNGPVSGYFSRLQWRLPGSNPGGTCDGLASSNDWQTFDNGTSGFRPLTDVDMSGETDAGDISQVLLDFNTRSDDLPPPPIDCTINAPR
jgi:hypothetical protein